jgi:hypothetical protein
VPANLGRVTVSGDEIYTMRRLILWFSAKYYNDLMLVLLPLLHRLSERQI